VESAAAGPDDPYADLLTELRGPVASMQSYVRTLVARDEELSHAARATIYQVLLEQTKRLDGVFDDVVLYVRLLTGAVDVQPEHFLLGAVLEDVRQRSREPDRVDVEVEASVAVHTDRRALAAILRRLVRNGLVYGPRDGVTTVRATAAGGLVEVAVCDTGWGIAADVMDRALEPFGRRVADKERRKDGAGLGLTVARELCELLGGELVLRDNEPGLCAAVRLPSEPGVA
jgi:signal transduction histidine kinase